MRDWLDLELSEHLKPVNAPRELWHRVSAAPVRPHRSWMPVPVVALLMLLTAAGALWFAAKGETPHPQFARAHAQKGAECLLCHSL